MDLKPIPIDRFLAHSFKMWEPDWLLLTCGDFSAGHFNSMTISWGTAGIMWGRPILNVVVRPQRYTRQFMEQYPSFTVCAFPKQYRPALNILGSLSGRSGDKISKSGLIPQASTLVASPSFSQAELVFECKKIYWSDFDPAHFLDAEIDRNYPKQDYHRSYFGQILTIRGTEDYT
jgi:flavin reductase (DIM6/NTAB) family NADH-FMN oxidoreductase RutF